MYVRHEGIRACAIKERAWPRATRDDPFAELVRQVHDDPANPYNLDGYLWVLEEPAPRECPSCGALFDPALGHDGTLSRRHRRYCSLRCGRRAAERRRRQARTAAVGERWGSAA